MRLLEKLDDFAKSLGYINRWWFLKDVILIALFLSVIANYWVNEKSYCQELVRWYNKTCPFTPEEFERLNMTLNYSTGNWSIITGD